MFLLGFHSKWTALGVVQVDPVCYTVVSDTPYNYLFNNTKSNCIPLGCMGKHFFNLGSPTNMFISAAVDAT